MNFAAFTCLKKKVAPKAPENPEVVGTLNVVWMWKLTSVVFVYRLSLAFDIRWLADTFPFGKQLKWCSFVIKDFLAEQNLQVSCHFPHHRSFFSAIIQNAMENSHWLFMKGIQGVGLQKYVIPAALYHWCSNSSVSTCFSTMCFTDFNIAIIFDESFIRLILFHHFVKLIQF